MRMHNRRIVVAAVLSLALCAAAQQSMQAPQYTPAEIHRMEAVAHTASQYRALASYFRAKQLAYHQRAAAELREWHERNDINNGTYDKFPRPADSARNYYRYLTEQEQSMAKQAAHYEALAASARD